VLLAAGSVVLRQVASRGAVVGAGARQGRRGTGAADSLAGSWLPDGIVVKELLWLRRDKKALYAVISMPSLVLFQLGLLTNSPRRAYLLESTAHLPALAFLSGSVAVLSVAGLLQLDGKALWLTFTFPRSFTGMLARRAVTWAPVCLGFALLPLGYGLTRQPLSLELVFRSAYCLTGLSLFTLISMGLAVQAIDPDALEEEKRSFRGGRQVLLLTLLMATFASGFYGDHWLGVTLTLLLAAAALGVWQDVNRQVPFLLEPALSPPLRIGVSTGLVCVMVLLVLQAFGQHFATTRFGLAPWPSQGAAFLGSVGVVAAGTLARFWRADRAQVRSLGLTWGESRRATLLDGLYWAPLAIALAAAATCATHYLPWLEEWALAGARGQPALVQPIDWIVFLGLSLLGAPLCEELIFRGMIYGGLRESLSPRLSAALAAAAFVAFHPSSAAIPVFLISLVAAAVFERSRSLVPSILVHAAYNATVLLVTLWTTASTG